jgi:hypothetical protein
MDGTTSSSLYLLGLDAIEETIEEISGDKYGGEGGTHISEHKLLFLC